MTACRINYHVHVHLDVNYSVLCIVGVQYEQLNDLRVKFEASLQRQDDLHTKYDLSLSSDNLKVAALQAEEEAETIADQFLTGIIISYLLILANSCGLQVNSR